MNQQDAADVIAQLPLQFTSQEIWDQKYRLKDSHGNPVDADIHATYARTAKALAASEHPEKRASLEKEFLNALYMGATAAGRIMSNAGAIEHKSAVSLINCTVSDTIADSMESILDKVKEAGLTLKAGCGIGYEFSTLRPKGAFVSGAGSSTSGPLTFMDIYDKTCFTVSSAGGRRGAQMATFDVKHPDVMDFIKAKREDGRFRQFNCSLLITDEFVNAVRNDLSWQTEWKGQSFGPSIPAKQLWEAIMTSNYNFAEPGFLLIDRINQYNNLWFCEHLRATNPCGEQPLPPYGSCLLGSINLTRFVKNPFSRNAEFDYKTFYSTARLFARMLDNVVEQNGLPLAQQRHEIAHKRRHGMGYFGVGSALIMLGIKYGSPAAVAFTDEVTKQMAFANFEEGAMLAKEKGEAPVLQARYTDKEIQEGGFAKYNNNYAVGESNTYTGRELFLMSHYFDAWRDDPEGQRILALLQEHGSRYSHATSIAPTGTIALSFGNNASNGIEPSFSHHYIRNVIVEGFHAKQKMDVYSYEYLLYKSMIDAEAKPEIMSQAIYQDAVVRTGRDELEVCKELHILPRYFAATDDLTPKEHVDIQAASQKWIDSSISKTINVPTDIPFADFEDIYMYAYDKGLKGCTTFRFNPAAFQGVLVKSSDLTATMYEFTLEDGSVVVAPGDAIVDYNGQKQTAANLFDAIKENYYAKL